GLASGGTPLSDPTLPRLAVGRPGREGGDVAGQRGSLASGALGTVGLGPAGEGVVLVHRADDQAGRYFLKGAIDAFVLQKLLVLLQQGDGLRVIDDEGECLRFCGGHSVVGASFVLVRAAVKSGE